MNVFVKYIIFAFFLFSSCCSQNDKRMNVITNDVDNVDKGVRVLQTLELRKDTYKDVYKILHTDSYENVEKIKILKNNKEISYIDVPNGTDVKNLSIYNISETKKGFRIKLTWGGGRNFYNKTYYFDFINGGFYLGRILSNDCIIDEEKYKDPDYHCEETYREIIPRLHIDNFELDDWIY